MYCYFCLPQWASVMVEKGSKWLPDGVQRAPLPSLPALEEVYEASLRTVRMRERKGVCYATKK